ncbi:phosphate/phosphite/phosphonate ABC transporter substrate-binding protein [Oricola cellulosilytica]|uniref:Phosphate/phosphite/phosphonate ABC transporter substrate-binding protein n=1 Tax=Oricola cellulosilytica TaxID=1429082 RepID=A0A4R0PLR2_9HYPH|nr:PhnD/SsuA/transferrin family substrate-binding protein [Oricola cellulosilytica]TCD16369.1 hypothetical protein E0D97_02770 [Oricola cellulosilytica]
MAPRHGRNKMMALASVVLCCLLSAPASADWREDLGTFRIGIAMRNGESYPPGRFEEFRKAVSETLAMPVEIFQARDALALIDAQASSRIEYSVLSAMGYATAYELCQCIEPIAAPVSTSGASGIRSILLADKARAARTVDLGKVTIAAGPAGALGGDLLPTAGFFWRGKALAESGLDIVMTPGITETLEMLVDGRVAAAFLWEYVRPGAATSFGGGPKARLAEMSDAQYGVLWRSRPVRFGPHAIRRDLPSEVKTALRRMLLSLDEDRPLAHDAISPLLGGGFEAAAHDDYRTVLGLVPAVVEGGGD